MLLGYANAAGTTSPSLERAQTDFAWDALFRVMGLKAGLYLCLFQVVKGAAERRRPWPSAPLILPPLHRPEPWREAVKSTHTDDSRGRAIGCWFIAHSIDLGLAETHRARVAILRLKNPPGLWGTVAVSRQFGTKAATSLTT